MTINPYCWRYAASIIGSSIWEEKLQSNLGVGLRSKESILGFFCVVRKPGHRLSFPHLQKALHVL